jgi:2-polyprenyl-6-methoxyphenol hydroxylase-like FAD-dependent oxidoreductase
VTAVSGRYKDNSHAVVIGGSLAGLLTAAVLARHLDRVTVIERDRFPGEAAWRRGVPQARHAHNLMTAGHDAMERLFPGVRQELYAAGMVKVRMPEDMLLLTAGGWMPRFHTDLAMLTGSRPVIDSVILRRVKALPQVTFLEETETVGLITGPDHKRVLGVRVRRKSPSGTTGWDRPEDLTADLVVDAAGRNSRLPEWLVALGYGETSQSVVDAQTAYSTCVFEPPAGHSADWNCVLLQYSPSNPRQGILNPIEDGRWMVSLAALGGDKPPIDPEGFLRFALRLRSPVLYEVLRDAQPVTPIHRSGRTENRRRHFERLPRWPERLVAVGDVAGALNPSYGQGMSVSARSALALDSLLTSARSLDDVGSRFRRRVAKCIDLAWSIAATADLAYPGAAPTVGRGARMQLGYLYRVINAAPTSVAASRALLDINQMVASPQAVTRPRVLLAALRAPRRAGTVTWGPPPQLPPSARRAPSPAKAN